MISLVIVNIAALIVDDFVGRLIYKAVNVKEYMCQVCTFWTKLHNQGFTLGVNPYYC